MLRPSGSACAAALARAGAGARLGAIALAAVAPACSPCAPLPTAAPASPRASEPALVYYPAGECSGELAIELYDRSAQAWRQHGRHPRLTPGSCAYEDARGLLNELRVRCEDPTGRRAPSAWIVGAELGAGTPPCKGEPVR